MANRRKASQTPRREFLKLGFAAAAFGPFFSFPSRALLSQKTLRIAKWAHFVPGFDAWFEKMAKEWGEQHETKVALDNVPLEKIHETAAAEVRTGSGHDIVMFPWPAAEFQQHAIDHADIYQGVTAKYGSIPLIAYKLKKKK